MRNVLNGDTDRIDRTSFANSRQSEFGDASVDAGQDVRLLGSVSSTRQLALNLREMISVRTAIVLLAGWMAFGIGSASQEFGESTSVGAQESLTLDGSLADDIVEKFVRDLLTTVAHDSARDFSALVEWETILDKALRGFSESDSAISFRTGFLETIEGPGGFPASVVSAVNDGGSLTFIRRIDTNGNDCVLLRLTLPTGGFNYLQLYLNESDEGRVRVVDIYPFSNGELMSQTLRRAYLPLAKLEQAEDADMIDQKDSLFITHASDYSRFAELVAANEADRAMEIYNRLPPELQRDKSALLLRLRATQQLGNDQYGEALTAIRTEYPNDPSSDLLSIDAYLLAEDYDSALSCLDRLEQRVEGDVYLDTQRAAVKILQQDWDAAEAFARKAIVDPGVRLQAYWSLVAISLGRDDPEETFELLKQMDDQFEMEWVDMATLPDYRSFVESPFYDRWQEYLRDRTNNRSL